MSRLHPLFLAVKKLTDPDSHYSATERLVALALAHHLGRDGSCFPSQRSIVQWTGLSLRPVVYALSKLTGPGGLFIKTPGGAPKGGTRTPTVYRFSTSAVEAPVTSAAGAPVNAPTSAADAPRPVLQSQRNYKENCKRIAACRRTRNGSGKGNGASWSKEACGDWIARFGGTAPGEKIGAALKPLVGAHGWSRVRGGWRTYLESATAQFASAARFAQTFNDWVPPDASAPAAEPQGPEFSGPRKEFARGR